ncbi:MAG: amidohydrolase family protein [Bacteroidota bacterium]
MKTRIIQLAGIMMFAAQMATAQVLPVVAPAQAGPVILKGATIHVGTGEVIENGSIAFKAGKITAVGKEILLADKAEYTNIDVSGKEVYPGLICLNTTLGLFEIGAVDVTLDMQETGQMNPGVRSAVAYNTDSHVIPVVRSNGILLAQITPQGGTLSGTSSVVQLDAWNWEDAVYKLDEGVHLNWPRMAPLTGRAAMRASYMGGDAAGNYDKTVEELETMFTDAAAYAGMVSPGQRNLHLESFRGLFDGTKTLYIHTTESKGIIASVNFAKKHGVKRLVLVGAGEGAWMVKDFIKENKLPVILGHIHSMPEYEHSDTRLPFKLALMFSDEGILTGITYASAAYGFNLPFVAGQAVAYGLGKEEALSMVTLNNARILGIDDRTGSLEAGKDANIVVSNGDLLDMMTNDVVQAYICGRNIDLDNKHKMLYRRFSEKYKQQASNQD